MERRKRTRQEVQKVLHRLSQRYKLRTLKIVHEKGNPEKHLYKCYEKPMKRVTISEYCEHCNQMKQAIGNVEEKYGQKYEPNPLLHNINCASAYEEPEYPPDLLYVNPKPDTGERLRQYELHSSTPSPVEDFGSVHMRFLKSYLKRE